MKKTLLIMICCALLVSMPSCDNIGADVEESTADTTDTNEIINTADTAYTDTVDSDSPEMSQLAYQLSEASIWTDTKGEYYIHINEWDSYLHLPELSSYKCHYFNDNCIVVNGETATISVIDQDEKHDEPTIITYHLNKSNKLVEWNDALLNIKASSEYDTFFVNMHDKDHGYYFLTPNLFGYSDERMVQRDGAREWPLYMFETTDGGKSWNQISTNTFYITKYIHIIKFISPQVGIISARDEGAEELFDRTYITVDGGLTWKQMTQLPYAEGGEWYSEVIDFEYVKDYDYYRLTVEAYNSGEVQFRSEDLINWSLI